MIESIMTVGLWAESLTERTEVRTVTVYIGEATRRPRVTAQINLARLEGRGTAKAVIVGYEQLARFGTEPKYTAVHPPLDASDPRILFAGQSGISFTDAYSVTFGVIAKNVFAYANCTVFVHQVRSVVDILLAPMISFVGRLRGP